MICNKCGHNVPDGIYYCENCGEPVSQTYNQQPFNADSQYTQQSYSQPNNQYSQQTNSQSYNQQYQQNGNYAPYGQPVTPQAFDFMLDNKIDEVKTLGIIAIIVGFFIPLAGIIIACIGISKLNDIPILPQYAYEKELNRKKAKKLCIIGIVLPIVLRVVLFLFVILIWGLLLGGLAALGEFAFIM